MKKGSPNGTLILEAGNAFYAMLLLDSYVRIRNAI
jgi:hypothetical protein